MMSGTVQKGYFFIADISGYTKFLAETEIQHAKGVLESLFNAMLPSLDAPMALSGMRGDAIFAYAVDSEIVSKQFILDMAEKIYCVFSRARDKIDINTNCPCSACTNISKLDLKVIVHHGEFIVQESGGTKELAGTDVNTVFRLLKNNVEENTGLNAYALMTCDAIRQMDLGDYFPEDSFHTETYEHIGEVVYVVHNLKEVFEKRKDKHPVYVDQDDPQIVPETVTKVPMTADAAFVMCSRPDLRKIWVAADQIEEINKKGNVVDIGSVYNCHHGDDVFVFEIVDWRPGEYVTGEYCLPMGMRLRETNEIVQVGDGYVIKNRYSDLMANSFLGKMMTFLAKGKIKKLFTGASVQCSLNLASLSKEMVEKDHSLGVVAHIA